MPVRAVRVAAPGKAILCGEHAVVHGRTAVAVSLGLRTYVSIEPASAPGFHLQLPDVDVDEVFSVDAVRSLRPTAPVDVFATPPAIEPELRDQLSAAVAATPHVPSAQARTVFVYLAAHLLPDDLSAWALVIRVKSTLPIGAGLGSSASYSTALAGAILALRATVDEACAERLSRSHVNAWAFRAEQLIHGNPSGVDNQVATFGGALAFKSGSVTPIKNVKAMNFLLTNTRVPRSTRELVAGVGRRLAAHPAVMERMLDAIQAISDEALALISEVATASSKEAELPLYDRLQTLMAMNHHLLNAMGVGHRALDDHGLQSKLTGAGGGGCAITLLRPDTPRSVVAAAETALTALGFQCLCADVGVAGVTAYDVAVGGATDVAQWQPIHNVFHEN